jgi:hypothetical protein
MRLIKTETGQLAFKERSPFFSGCQRSLFILFDGQKSVKQVLAATSGLGATQADVEHLIAHGFLENAAAAPADVPGAVPGAVPVTAPMALTAATTPVSGPDPAAVGKSAQERYAEGKVLATRLTASLGLRGFMLNLSVESAAGYDDLLKLFPKIQAAVGEKAARELERALKG